MRNAECRSFIPHSSFPIQHSERGIALLIVVSVLTVIGIMGVSFAFSMYLETQAARQFVSTNQARYLAEAGVNHARVLLDEDRLGSRVDELTESWVTIPAGADVDVDGDGTADAVWWPVNGVAGSPVGRYALKITDEASKANLNAAQAHPTPPGLEGINLTTILQEAHISNPAQVAEAIERYRYGNDQRPGKAGVDDDGDGAIDEPDEYQVLALAGDDRRIEGLGELAAIAGLSADELRRLSAVATVYSWDLNVSVTEKTRVNVNTATAPELLEVLLDAGVADPWHAAVNMADYVDADMEFSRVTKSSQLALLANEGLLGSWSWSDEPMGHYRSDGPGGAALSWSMPAPSGKFRLLVRGVKGVKVGDVTVAGQLTPSVDDGVSLGIFELSGGSLAVEVVNREAAGVPCAFRGIELVSTGAQTGVMVRGIEAVRFNELMVEPTIQFNVSTATFQPQSSGWGCPVGAAVCQNSGVGEAKWEWTTTLLQPGHYYAQVLAASTGQTVGQVDIGGPPKLLIHEQVHPSTMVVGSDGKIRVTIGKTASDGTYYFQGLVLSLQPDAEYVELINLSDAKVDVSSWTVEGELAGGRQGRFPAGSMIEPHGLIVAAVDLADTQSTLANNGIDARSAWEMSDKVNAVQLEFPSGVPSPGDDWLKKRGPSGTSSLILRAGSAIVDEVEYPVPSATTMQSIEKGDPTVIVDADQDGIDEGWHPSLQLFTPGLPNDNEGLKEIVGPQTIVHDPSEETLVLNRPLGSIGELAGLASGAAWAPFSTTDLAKIVDRLTVEGYRLESEGHLADSQGEGAWHEQADGYVHTDPAKAGIAGRWRWAALPDGKYRLSLYGCAGCQGEQMSVRWERGDETFTDWSPPLSTDAQGRVVIGQITIGKPADPGQGPAEGTPSQTLTLEVTCSSPSGICHADHVRLDPQLIRIGPVNVNTAPVGVLLALPGMTDALASRIIAGRPYGDKNHTGRGIGDLFLGDVLGTDEEAKLETFRRLAHLLTTRSEVFQILSLGQGMDGSRVQATQRVQTIVQR